MSLAAPLSRPIAVSSVIYRILAKTIIISMRDVLPTVVSNCQKAFQQNQFITDCTRMVQDVMEYCDRENEEGFLLFCDQDAAYPRVEWDFMFSVLNEMNFHPDLVRTVKMMYDGIQLRFKVNSVVDSTVAKPTNGLAQGCPLSPVLYLLYLQTFISLISTAPSDVLRTINIPGPLGDTAMRQTDARRGERFC